MLEVFTFFLFFHCCSDIFSQLADPTGIMIYSQFDQFLKEALKLPVTVFEGPSFSYTEQSARTCFAQQVGKPLLFAFYIWLWNIIQINK